MTFAVDGTTQTVPHLQVRAPDVVHTPPAPRGELPVPTGGGRRRVGLGVQKLRARLTRSAPPLRTLATGD
jgi:hypothetical protein